MTDDILKERLKDALNVHEDFLLNWITSPPQTNEVRRSAVLIAGAHHLARMTGVQRLACQSWGQVPD